MKRGRSLFHDAREEQLVVRATTTIKMSVSDPKRTKAGKTGFQRPSEVGIFDQDGYERRGSTETRLRSTRITD